MFGFPQALDEQDMDVGAESEQAMLPTSLSMEYQGTKPKSAIHGFDINSGLSVCQHLRGETMKCLIILLSIGTESSELLLTT